MRKLSVFETITLDGYFTGPDNDMAWAHAGTEDAEFTRFTAGNAGREGVLLFGRVTYEMMVAFWPTPQAAEMMPEVAEGMNRREKIVFSRTLKQADWNNTRVIGGDMVEAVRALKAEAGPDLVILGSGSIAQQLVQARLIDSYQLVIAPLALGAGRTVFDGMTEKVGLKLTDSRTFQNGRVFVSYEVA